MLIALFIVIGYLAGSITFGYWLVRCDEGRRHPHGRQPQHRRDERLADVRLALRAAGDAARRAQGVRAGRDRDARLRRAGRRAHRRRGDGRARAADLPEVREGREDGGDGGRRVPRRRAGARASSARRCGS